jgi:hypothetical protein
LAVRPRPHSAPEDHTTAIGKYRNPSQFDAHPAHVHTAVAPSFDSVIVRSRRMAVQGQWSAHVRRVRLPNTYSGER